MVSLMSGIRDFDIAPQALTILGAYFMLSIRCAPANLDIFERSIVQATSLFLGSLFYGASLPRHQ